MGHPVLSSEQSAEVAPSSPQQECPYPHRLWASGRPLWPVAPLSTWPPSHSALGCPSATGVMWGEQPARAQIQPLPSLRLPSFSAALCQPANWDRGDRLPHRVPQGRDGDAGSARPAQHLSQGPVSVEEYCLPGRRAEGRGCPCSQPTCRADGRGHSLDRQTDGQLPCPGLGPSRGPRSDGPARPLAQFSPAGV